MGKKGVMTSSAVNRIGGSNVKEGKMPPIASKDRLNVKGLSTSLSYSSQKQREKEADNKNYYNSPFKNGQNFWVINILSRNLCLTISCIDN